MSISNSTIPKCLVNVPESGIWISKTIGKSHSVFHCHFGNSSICNTQELLEQKSDDYTLKSTSYQKCCKECLGLIKNKTKRTEIKTNRVRLSALYRQEIITPEHAITNLITDPENRPASYNIIKETFSENFSKFSFEDTVSFMVISGQILLQDDKILPIVEGEILS